MKDDNPKFDFKTKHYYGDKFLRDVTFLKDGRQHGPLITFTSNGEISTVENYEDGELTSSKLYGENGFMESYNEFKDGKKEGKSLWYVNEKLYKKAKYKKGKLIKKKFFHENGELIVDFKYDNGKLNGETTFYFDDGSKHCVINYKENKKHGEFIHFSKNGLSMKGNNTNDLLDGEITFYLRPYPNVEKTRRLVYENGKIKSKVNINDSEDYFMLDRIRLIYTFPVEQNMGEH